MEWPCVGWAVGQAACWVASLMFNCAECNKLLPFIASVFSCHSMEACCLDAHAVSKSLCDVKGSTKASCNTPEHSLSVTKQLHRNECKMGALSCSCVTREATRPSKCGLATAGRRKLLNCGRESTAARQMSPQDWERHWCGNGRVTDSDTEACSNDDKTENTRF